MITSKIIQQLYGHLDLDELMIHSFKDDSKNQHKRNLSYLISYPVFISYFSSRVSLDREDLIIAGNLAYAWMPTVLVWKSHSFDSVLKILNKAKKSSSFDLSAKELESIRKLVNGSIVGMSKVLHFVNPECYPIWDSRIYETIHSDESRKLTIGGYVEYGTELNRLKNSDAINQMKLSFDKILGYSITNLRAIEMVLFYSKVNIADLNLASAKTLVLPKYKRDGFVFISNLGKITANEEYELTFKRDGYLISEHYLTPSLKKLAKVVKTRKNLLISDNGNFTRIKAIANIYKEKGLALYKQAKKEVADSGVISQSTIDERLGLIDEIGKVSEEAIKNVDITEITEKQLSVGPDYMIGMEDLTIPSLMLSNLMHPIFKPSETEVVKYQNKTLEIYGRQYNGAWGSQEEMENVVNFLVIHAYDYFSAYQGSSLSESWKKDGVAISYGGPMLSNRWITQVKFHLD